MNIDDLFEKAKDATFGPWTSFTGNEGSGVNCLDGQSLTWDDHGGEVLSEEDALFIAAANPAVVMELIDYARALRLDVEKMERNEEKILQENLSLQRKLSLYSTAMNISNAEIKTTNFTAEEIADMEEK